jgi:Xaa-Pro aminopeptidase
LQEVGGVNWLPRQGLVEELRAIKDQAELNAIRNAAKITDGVMNRVAEIAITGMTEAELAWELECAMRFGGAARMTFPVIVASGPNAALPHHMPGDRRLQRGDILLVDMGASFSGYGSDLTRTFIIGETPDRHFEERYDVVARAHGAAIQGLGPNVTGREVDRLARNVIADAGYGEQFGHGLGHGVGLEGHEAPRLSTTASDAPLAPGMVATVEPGIYVPGWGGIRIEDLVLITASGHEVISQCPKEPLINL